MKELGENLKAFRLRKKMTLADLSRKAEVSKSQLSQIERNTSAPTVTRLARIADALEVDISDLLSEAGAPRNAPPSNKNAADSRRIEVVRGGERRKVLMPWGAWYEILCPDLRHRIEFLYLHYPAGTSAAEPYSHQGEECGLVLEGRFRGIFEDREVILEPGDSVYYDSSIPHYWETVGDTDVRAIWAITPPSF